MGYSCVAALMMTAMMAVAASAQDVYVAGGGGVAGGTGGSAGTFQFSAGYLTSHRFGLEVEVSGVNGLDFGRRDLPSLEAALPRSPFAPGFTFPSVSIESRGRLLSVHTNVLVPLYKGPRLRVLAIAGGGAGALRTTTHLHQDAVDLPGIPDLPFPFPFPRIIIPERDITTTHTDTALSFGAGGAIEYLLTTRLGAGADVRYVHVFTDRSMNTVRLGGRLAWHF